MNTQRHCHTVSGQVQGVGFRPFVYRLAREHALTGHVSNTSAGVVIEVQGTEDALTAFAHSLHHDLPPLARIVHSTHALLPPLVVEHAFTILASPLSTHAGHNVRISPDVATCAACLADIENPQNRRYGYAFTNCTNCGPRYTITRTIPYDRATTSMACFVQCTQCQAEYDNPDDRRFHAQPNACPVCGPQVWVQESLTDTVVSAEQAFAHAADALCAGKIIAIKGLGGFHLACNATHIPAIEELRRRKHRPHKPLAVMVRDMDVAHAFAHISDAAAVLLKSRERPIVVCPRLDSVPDILSPDTPTLGLMLPYTPLHHALFATLAQRDPALTALVMTSGNAGGEPICVGNREALTRMAPLADLFLLHNRDILVRVDDSVLTPSTPVPLLHRRARGYVPRGTALVSSGPCVLGAGGELKATLCLTRGDTAFVSQHIGDVENLETYAFYEEVAAHLEMLLETQPEAVVCDMHPDFLTSRFARELAHTRAIPLFPLQHHVAHAWSVLAENQHQGPALVWVLDGAGYSGDGTVWGGELVWVDTQHATHRRVGRCAPFVLPGGDAAVREPWRIAQGLLLETGLDAALAVDNAAREAVTRMVRGNIRCVLTSSAGRLFDAVAAVLGLCTHTTYEGQAAIRLETAQCKAPRTDITDTLGYEVPWIVRGELVELDSQALFIAVVKDKQRGVHTATIARRFHVGLARGLAAMAQHAAKEHDTRHVGLSGGVMQNATLATLLPFYIERAGLYALAHRDIPAHDGGLSLGQAAFGQKSL